MIEWIVIGVLGYATIKYIIAPCIYALIIWSAINS